MRTTTLADSAGEAVVVCVSHADGVVAARAEAPDAGLLAVEVRLVGDPVEETAELSVWRGRVGRDGGAVACTGDLEDECCDAVLAPAFHPDAEFGAVAVEAGDEDQKGHGRGFCSGFG